MPPVARRLRGLATVPFRQRWSGRRSGSGRRRRSSVVRLPTMRYRAEGPLHGGGTPMEKLLERVAALESAVQVMQSERQATKRRLNRWRGLSAVLGLLVLVGLAPRAGHAALTLD